MRPAHHPDCEFEPLWWDRMAAAASRTLPPPTDEDPRVVGAEMGLLAPPEQLDGVPTESDYDALTSALRAEAAAAAHVRLGADRRGALACVFRFPFDEDLNAAVKRIPGRRFEWDVREWTVPCDAAVAREVAALLSRFPHVVPAPAVLEWLAEISRWRAHGAAWDTGDGPVIAVRSRGGTPPPALLADCREERDGWMVLPLDVDVARRVTEAEGLELDAVAAAAVRAVMAGSQPAGALLELGIDADGLERFELHVGTRVDVVHEFRCLPEAARAGGREGYFLLAEQAELLAVPADPALLDDLDDFLDRNDYVVVTPAAEARRYELRTERRRAKAAIALSLAEDADLEVATLAGELQPFQRAGVRYALEQRRTFLADEQGLGKTIQALAAIEAAGCYPAIVVCPASLKLTWQREAERWLPHRRTATLHGRASDGFARACAEQADIVILNYDVVEAHHEALTARAPRAAVFDESHYCKEPRAKRTKACLALSAAVPADGLRLALTGTPILNRPKELVSQLRLIGRLSDFGSGADMARRFKGPDALQRLHWHLRAHCYVRRSKADVLPQLPAKRQAAIPVALANETEYRLAERDVIAWLRAQPLDLRTLEAKVAAALRNERLVQLNKLRQLAARGKLRAAVEWIDDFVASGEPLVVFADHVEVQRALVDRYPSAAHVLGDDSPAMRDAAVTAFQDPDGPQMIVCSLRAAGHGLTLTRASNVAFLELDWTPARLEQAEDRCHRIGQADAVTAWYLVAPDTIDETMAELVAHKRGVIGAVTDGRIAVAESLVDAVVRDLRDGRSAGVAANSA
jgi:superfamily II DNA or RNA helicase